MLFFLNKANFVEVNNNNQHNNKKMNTAELRGKWEEQKIQLKQKFVELTDKDLLFIDGKKEEMLGKLQIKLGKTKEELNRIIEKL